YHSFIPFKTFLLCSLSSGNTAMTILRGLREYKNPLTPQSLSNFAISTVFLPFVSILYLILIASDRIMIIYISPLQCRTSQQIYICLDVTSHSTVYIHPLL